MLQMWQACKSYFGDGFVSASSPLRYDVHICDIKRPPIKNDNHYGVELDEDAFPLFSTLGETRQPPCTCHDMQALVAYIDKLLETLPDSDADDFSLHTGKGDSSVEEASVYVMRDALCWWAHMHGSLEPGDRWKLLYVAISTLPDDVQIPPRRVVDGTWRYLGHTLSEILDGLRAEGMHPDDVKLAEMCLWRQLIVQYLEKVAPGLRALLVGKMTLMAQFRNISGNGHGVAVCLAAARGVQTRGVSDEVVEMSAICDVLSLDIAKEVMGILRGEQTETVAGDRSLRKQELRWVYVRCMMHLNAHPEGQTLKRFASAGLHYVPMMDRYLERVRMARLPLTPAARGIIDKYVHENVSECGTK